MNIIRNGKGTLAAKECEATLSHIEPSDPGAYIYIYIYVDRQLIPAHKLA